jgi:hypothetical protein
MALLPAFMSHAFERLRYVVQLSQFIKKTIRPGFEAHLQIVWVRIIRQHNQAGIGLILWIAYGPGTWDAIAETWFSCRDRADQM